MITTPILAVFAVCGWCLAADASIGVWKLNVSKSQYEGGPIPVKSAVMIREAAEGGARVSQTGVRADGTQLNIRYELRYDGTECTVKGVGAPFDTIATKQIDANTYTDERRKQNGAFKAAAQTIVSKDGKTLTVKARGTNSEGTPFTSTLVFERQ